MLTFVKVFASIQYNFTLAVILDYLSLIYPEQIDNNLKII